MSLPALAQRYLKLHCTIQDGAMMIGDGNATIEVHWEILKGNP